jgi:DNA mismatch repair protein MutS
MRDQLARADELRYAYQKERWFLDAAETYCETAARFASDLERVDVRSRGLLGIRYHLTGYVRSAGFRSLQEETRELRERAGRGALLGQDQGPKGHGATLRR